MGTHGSAPLLKARFPTTRRTAMWYCRALRAAAGCGRPDRPGAAVAGTGRPACELRRHGRL